MIRIGQAKILVVMYHYVKTRHNKHCNYCVDLIDFENQIDTFCRNFNVIDYNDFKSYINGELQSLPENPVLLTFDDGYMDHYTNVLPVLLDHSITGVFFVSTKPVIDKKYLDINRIHFILGHNDPKRVFSMLNDILISININTERCIKKYAIGNSLNTNEEAYIKRMLQFGLDEKIRDHIIEKLANRLGVNMPGVDDIYMSANQIKTMYKSGMTIGIHGYSHNHLGTMSEEDQRTDILKSIDHLELLGIKPDCISYPCNSFNDHTIDILKNETYISTAFAVENLFVPYKIDKYRIPRMDIAELRSRKWI